MTSFADPRVTHAIHATVADRCRASSTDFRTWRLRCSGEPRLHVVRLGFAWRRYPAYLGSVLTSAPGPFRVVGRTPDRIVARRGSTNLVFLRLEAHAAAAAFRRGLVDEAPVPVGDLAAARRRGLPARVTQLLGVDLVDFGGALARLPRLRRAYFDTADRTTYRDLVSEDAAPTTVSLLHRGGDVTPARFRAARKAVPDLPRVRLPLEAPSDPAERYAATLVYGQWRNVLLGPELVRRSRVRFRRVIAPYASPEALFLAVSQRLARPALGLANPLPALERIDRRLRERAEIVPLAWVADARLVSRCLRGWREDRLGRVAYARVHRVGACG